MMKKSKKRKKYERARKKGKKGQKSYAKGKRGVTFGVTFSQKMLRRLRQVTLHA
jgi:hypothetical protein